MFTSKTTSTYRRGNSIKGFLARLAIVLLSATGPAWSKVASDETYAGRSQAEADEVPVAKVQPLLSEQIAPGRYVFTTLAGAVGTKGHEDGEAASARFNNPRELVVDLSGNVYVSDSGSNTIRKITPAGIVTTIAGAPDQSGSQDGRGPAARFASPLGLAVDTAGNVFVADSGNHTIRKIDPDGNVTTVAGAAGESGYVDGSARAARFQNPSYVEVDGDGNLFVTESLPGYHGRLRKIASDGTVSTPKITFLNLSPAWMSDYESGIPTHIRCDQTGKLYVIYTDTAFYSDVVVLTPGPGGGYKGQTAKRGGDGWATGLGLDASGNLYIQCDSTMFFCVSADGDDQTVYIAGDPDKHSWSGLAVDSFGTLFAIPDTNGESTGTIDVAVFDPATSGPVILGQPHDSRLRLGETASFSVWALGSTPLKFQWYLGSVPIPGATEDKLELKNIQPSDAGLYRVVVTDGVVELTSRQAQLTVMESITRSVSPPAPASGGGSVSPQFLLALAALVTARAVRGRRILRECPVDSAELSE